MNNIINTAFILSAGKGTRLRPYTDTIPKPMVSVWGQPIIEHIVKKCEKDGIENIIINLNYLGHKIKSNFSHHINIHFSEEKELLDTGGGLKLARKYIEEDALFLVNGDAFWTEGKKQSAFQNLSCEWNPQKMDILLLLQPVSSMSVTGGVGDYDMDKNGQLTRSLDQTGAFMFTGIRITKLNVLDGIKEDIFSFRKCMDNAETNNKLYGIIHDGEWHHISTPADLENVNHLPHKILKACDE